MLNMSVPAYARDTLYTWLIFFISHTENMALQYYVTEVFSSVKIESSVRKKNDIFNMFAQNIDCGYTC